MDLEEEWELLPDEGFLQVHDDGGKKIFSRKYGPAADPKSTVFDMDYFICPSSVPSPASADSDLVPVLPIQLEPRLDRESLKQVDTIEVEKLLNCPNTAEQDTVSQVFFKKMKENEFVDMKMDSPKSGGMGIVPQLEDKTKTEKETLNLDPDTKEDEAVAAAASNMWKWSLNGIGAICSFGVAAAAATIWVVVFGGHQKSKLPHSQKLQFQIYTDDKVVHHAAKLNEAISAVRGVPLSRAHITIGGYYDGI
ncbi:uncharacterized protein LOC127788449 isoform X2 [Diospyros lotus]|uniref:uncharacterized protein LOC127788449 isoform X2 n=1 Tax=Diospyros lotus TaxID=55363 RepID=UPI00224DB353|nr:uncharacterized protein LOC127788449 isoform X2 [Diospyros lotus]